jgi:hypothetical protein
VNIFAALYELTKFDHRTCDAAIVAHGVRPAVIKNGSSFEGIFIGSAVIVVWSVLLVWATVRAYRRAASEWRRLGWRWWGPLMGGIAALCCYLQGRALIEYAETCRALLHRS